MAKYPGFVDVQGTNGPLELPQELLGQYEIPVMADPELAQPDPGMPLGAAPDLGVEPLQAPDMPPPVQTAPPPEPAGGQSTAARFSWKGVVPGSVGPSHFQKIDPTNMQQGYAAVGDDMAATADKQRAAADMAYGAQTQVDEIEQHGQEQAAAQQHAEAERQAAANDYIQSSLADEEKRIMQARMAVPSMNPNRVFQNMTNFQRGLLSVLAGIAGGLAVAQGHNKNAVIETAMQWVDNDMKAQQTDIETKREDVYRAERSYDRMSQRLAGEENSKRELAIYKLEALKTAIGAEKMKFASVFTQAKHDKAIAAIDEHQNSLFMDYMKQYNDDLLATVQANNQAEYQRQQIAIARGQLAVSMMAERRQAAEAKAKADAAKNKQYLKLGQATGYKRQVGVGPDGKPVYEDVTINTGDEVVDRRIHEDLNKKGLAANKLYEALGTMLTLDMSHVKGVDDLSKLKGQYNKAILAWSEQTGQKLSRTTEQDVNRAFEAMMGTKKLGYIDLESEERLKAAVQETLDETHEAMTREGQGPTADTSITWEPPSLRTEQSKNITGADQAFEKFEESGLKSAPVTPDDYELAPASQADLPSTYTPSLADEKRLASGDFGKKLQPKAGSALNDQAKADAEFARTVAKEAAAGNINEAKLAQMVPEFYARAKLLKDQGRKAEAREVREAAEIIRDALGPAGKAKAEKAKAREEESAKRPPLAPSGSIKLQ